MMKEVFTPYDTAEFLTDDETIKYYLEEVMGESGDDPAAVANALGVVARARNMSQLARDVGMSRKGLQKALSGDGNPTLGTVMKVAKALGLRLEFRPVS
jgi:probable addiction module antidote protein